MCEFVCQISILISVAAIAQEKSFSVERIATRLTGRRQPVRGGPVAGILTPPRSKCSGGGAWVLPQTSAELWSQVWWPRFLSPSPPFLSSSHGRLRLVQAAVWPLMEETSGAGSLERNLPAKQ